MDETKQEKKITGTFEEFGTQPPYSKGKRSDMSELYQMVLDNMTNAEILAVNQDYILQIDKLDKIRVTVLTERYKASVRLDLEVTYISGATIGSVAIFVSLVNSCKPARNVSNHLTVR